MGATQAEKQGRSDTGRQAGRQRPSRCLPGIPAIGFRVKFVRGDEFNLPLCEVSKGGLLSPLNIQLEAKEKWPVSTEGTSPRPEGPPTFTPARD